MGYFCVSYSVFEKFYGENHEKGLGSLYFANVLRFECL